jgi:hypothetical protein
MPAFRPLEWQAIQRGERRTRCEQSFRKGAEIMSTSNESPTPVSKGPARDQLERLYREIGISAVAAAAAQLARPEKTEETRREMPAFLRDESRAA